MAGAPRVVTRAGSGFTLHLGKDEREVVTRLLAELRTMQADPDASRGHGAPVPGRAPR